MLNSTFLRPKDNGDASVGFKPLQKPRDKELAQVMEKIHRKIHHGKIS